MPTGDSSALYGLAVRGLETREQEEEWKVPGMEANHINSRASSGQTSGSSPGVPLRNCRQAPMTYLPKPRAPHSYNEDENNSTYPQVCFEN